MPQTSAPSRRPSRRFLVWILVLLLLGAVAYALLHTISSRSGRHRAGDSTDTAQPVAVTSAASGDMPVVLTELGTVIPITTVTIPARQSGYLTDVLFTEGQHVKKDDLLAVIDPRPYQATLEQYQGTLAQDQARLAQARLDNARYQRLIHQNSVAAMTAQDQEYLVKQYEGAVKTDQGMVDNEKLQVEYCYIRAPVDGRIGIRAVDRGNYVAVGQTNGLATLTQMQPISVIFTLPQDQLAEVAEQLHATQTLRVEAWDSSNTTKLADGTVSVLDSQIDTSTGTVRMRAIFTNEDERLFPNEFVNARLLVRTLHDVTLLPTNALQTGPDGQFVYVVQPDNTVAVHNVKVGVQNADTAVITSGVAVGDRVVTDGTNHLRAGAKITIPADHPQPAATDATQQQRHHRHQQAD
ncbi:multidrug efflux pump acriflavin resistance protein AcrB/AcrD/AcrF [Ameyamaea chiangmaiensis NBRC 103196]|uniref:Efflux RND transporter periplasmic adaptor subunit n=1 Tax=Ameyamaea chiangmaiensis TaxID=442969 RepID=A0A850PA79_9PROT|nr:efflux RND transporter periplasmic adaptor subunit [Ameyamaea chiangmaiensis]MBS4073989.1 efflux RND transporter periplasmic adaptor subunit [Ameyamaea chiangmaiensis]NVN40848.1 efflux RND transporter periplasmic adaptor subunit [Ameyamaea chiangmaiensis]GBQ67694.1 multidrug efflux pump acriflavin resistance protein AcrB/AcrD/AcrF [Ameyamaea chiangmaiensis NBRC 103196]